MPNAEILSIGTELLMGEITDTNSRFLAGELKLLGITASRMTTAGDDKEHLTQAFREALSRSGLIIASGGLGPTEDDLTRDCLAEALGEKMYVDPDIVQHLRKFFASFRRGPMPENNVRQAMLIPSAKAVPNPHGTAPGWWVEKDGKLIILIPGPPREMEPMWRKELRPRLETKFPGNIAMTRTLKVFGMGEGVVDEAVQPLFHLGNPELGIYAKPEGVHLRLIGRGENAAQLIADAEKRIREILKEHIWGTGDESLPGIAAKLLTEKKLTMSAFDAGTGGLLSTMLIEQRDSSGFYRGSIISNAANLDNWGISAANLKSSAVSQDAAAAMAAIAREKFGTAIGLGISGITGIDNPGDTPGTSYIGLADANGKTTWRQTIIPRHDLARGQLAVSAFFRLRQYLLGMKTGF